MAKAAIQWMTAEFDALDASLREAHAGFLRSHRDLLVMRVDDSNCLSRGFLTNVGGTEWLVAVR